MKATSQINLFFIAITLSLSACYPAHYATNDAYSLGLSQQGDIKVAGSYLGGKNGSSFNQEQKKFYQYSAQVAYSPINRLGLIGSFHKIHGGLQETPESWDAQNMEFAIGYYKKSAPKPSTPNTYILADVYAGIGQGKTNSVFETAGVADINYNRYFLHTGIHFGWKENIVIGFGLRYVFLDYQSVQLTGKIPEFFASDLDYIEESNPLNLFEPSFKIQGGNKYAKLFLTFSGTVLAKPNQTPLTYPGVNFGLMIEVDELLKKGK